MMNYFFIVSLFAINWAKQAIPFEADRVHGRAKVKLGKLNCWGKVIEAYSGRYL